MKRRKNVTIRQRQRFPASAASRQSFLSLLLLILSIIMQGSRSTTVRAYTRVELQYQQSMRSQLSSRFRFSLQQQSSSSSFIATAQLFNSKPYCWPSPYVKQLFDMQVPQGRCLGLALQADLSLQHQLDPAQLHASSHWIRTYLHPLEIDYGMRQVHPNTTISFLMGRLALRLALPPGSFENPMLKDEAGRPQLPRGYIGSISHKHAAACALVSAIADEQTFNNTILRRAALGVDMEVTKRESTCSIERKVLTEREREQLGSVKVRTNNQSLEQEDRAFTFYNIIYISCV
jgi:hypothetical protein